MSLNDYKIPRKAKTFKKKIKKKRNSEIMNKNIIIAHMKIAKMKLQHLLGIIHITRKIFQKNIN